MCNPLALVMGATSALGLGMQYKAQRDQKKEYMRARQVQENAQRQRELVANVMREEDRKLSDAKKQSIIQEAQILAPSTNRGVEMDKAQEDRTDSNVSALQEANNLGDGAVDMAAQGDHSQTYLKEKAKRTAEHGDKMISLARLYGANDATGDALRNQAIAGINPRLNQQALDAQRRAMQNSHQFMVNDITGKANVNGQIDPTKGSTLSALGGAITGIGLSGLGNYFGSVGGAPKANFNHLF